MFSYLLFCSDMSANEHAVYNFVAEVRRTTNKSTYSIPATLTDGQLSASLSTAGSFYNTYWMLHNCLLFNNNGCV